MGVQCIYGQDIHVMYISQDVCPLWAYTVPILWPLISSYAIQGVRIKPATSPDTLQMLVKRL